jgi:hypothetical protein
MTMKMMLDLTPNLVEVGVLAVVLVLGYSVYKATGIRKTR